MIFEPWNPLLSCAKDEFVEALAVVPPKPVEMERSVRASQGRAEPA